MAKFLLSSFLLLIAGAAAAQTPPHHPAPKIPVVQAPLPSHVKKPAPPAPAAAAQPPAPPPPADKEEPSKGSVTGLLLPRFVSLKTDDVNLRAGPGTNYPILWVYKRRELPVEIDREFDVWRQITTPDGTKGWVHAATLSARRGFIVTGGDHDLRAAADDAAAAVAVLKPDVVGHIRACAAGAAWCEVQVGDYRGWLKRADFWGVSPDEAIQ